MQLFNKKETKNNFNLKILYFQLLQKVSLNKEYLVSYLLSSNGIFSVTERI